MRNISFSITWPIVIGMLEPWAGALRWGLEWRPRAFPHLKYRAAFIRSRQLLLQLVAAWPIAYGFLCLPHVQTEARGCGPQQGGQEAFSQASPFGGGLFSTPLLLIGSTRRVKTASRRGTASLNPSCESARWSGLLKWLHL